MCICVYGLTSICYGCTTFLTLLFEHFNQLIRIFHYKVAAKELYILHFSALMQFKFNIDSSIREYWSIYLKLCYWIVFRKLTIMLMRNIQIGPASNILHNKMHSRLECHVSIIIAILFVQKYNKCTCSYTIPSASIVRTCQLCSLLCSIFTP